MNTPDHYAQEVQPIDLIESFGLNFHEGCIIKYVTRARWKGSHLLDLKKAKWYIDREIERHPDYQPATPQKVEGRR